MPIKTRPTAKNKTNSKTHHFEEQELNRDTFIWLVSHVCQLTNIPFDEVLLTQQFIPPYSTTTLQSALLQIGFELDVHRLEKASHYARLVPGIVFLHKAPSEPTDEQSNTDSGLLLRSDGEHLLWIDSSSTANHIAQTINQLKGRVSILFITHQMPESLVVDGVIKLDQGK